MEMFSLCLNCLRTHSHMLLYTPEAEKLSRISITLRQIMAPADEIVQEKSDTVSTITNFQHHLRENEELVPNTFTDGCQVQDEELDYGFQYFHPRTEYQAKHYHRYNKFTHKPGQNLGYSYTKGNTQARGQTGGYNE